MDPSLNSSGISRHPCYPAEVPYGALAPPQDEPGRAVAYRSELLDLVFFSIRVSHFLPVRM